MNKPVSFYLAQVLSANDYDRPVLFAYDNKGERVRFDIEGGYYNHNNEGSNSFSAPPIADVVMWLYETYGLWISVGYQLHSEGKHFYYNIRQANGIETKLWEFESPQDAYEKAIDFSLNLVNYTK